MPDQFGIVANVISDRIMRTGAKVWIVTFRGDGCAVRVNGLSKGGRRLQKYMHRKRLENFRAAWVPEHMRSESSTESGICYTWPTKQEAQAIADELTAIWDGVRFFHRDGRMLRDGITESEALARARSTRP